MERIEYDPEIDPSIRQEREAAERDRELAGRIRLEIERYVQDNDLVPRVAAEREMGTEAYGYVPENEEAEEPPHERDEKRRRRTSREEQRTAREELRAEKAEQKALKQEQRTARAKGRRKAVQGVLTGSVLTSEWMRRSWPYLLGFALLLVLYIANTFNLQKLHLERQSLETAVRELGVEAVRHTADRERGTRRSAIVERLAEKNIPLEEFPHPVKTVEKR